MQELVGRLGPGQPSRSAQLLLAELRAYHQDFYIVVPTEGLNENYSIARGHLDFEQLPDEVLRSPAGGKHLSRTIFTDRETGISVLHLNTHFVHLPENTPSRQQQARTADATARRADMPTVLTGDLNDTEHLGFTWLEYAPNERPTFAGYKATDINGGRRLDYVLTHDLSVDAVEVRGASATGWTTSPRLGDHLPLIVDLTATVR